MKPSKATILLFTLSILALQASCFSLSDVASLHMRPHTVMNAYAASTGEIPIFKDLDGYYVYTDLAYTTTKGQVGNDTVKMMLGLTNNNVLLTDSCLNFNQYPCDYYHCSKSSGDIETINYPYFVASTIKASAETYLDYAYWDVEEKVLLATACTTFASGYGAGRYGILGLGTQGDSKKNFLKTLMFSISIDSNLQTGTLKFVNNAQNSAPSVYNGLIASANWMIASKGFIQVGGYSISFRGSLAFDLNADALGLPSAMFQQAVQAIVSQEWVKQVVCTQDTYLPTCNYTGLVKDLPIIMVCTGQTNNVDFVIPPEVYVKNAKSADDYVYSITLNWKALDISGSGESYVTSDYKDTIIVDPRTMSYFDIVFDATSGSNFVRISTKHHDTPVKPTKWWVYVIIVCIVLVIIGGCLFVMKKRKANNEKPSVVVANATQEPLVVADNSMNYTNPVISGYNYQQQPVGFVPNDNYYQQQQSQGLAYAPNSTNNEYQYAKPGNQ